MMNRRQMLKTSAALGAVSFAATLPGIKAAAQATPPLRRSLQGMDLDDPILQTLREFVTMMSDPSRDGQNVSWEGFSGIHGTPSSFNLCPHGNWYFVPWHRAYIQMYEQAARALTGDDAFAMPYWDWTEDPGFPAAFGNDMIDGQPNSLFLPGRLMETGDEIPASVAGQGVMDIIYGSQTFEEFASTRGTGQNSTDPSWIRVRGNSGELESNPHDSIHCIIRDPFMCSGASPRDPIFQMHHCNIDRIWAVWNDMGGMNSTDPLWANMPFTNNFFAPDGSQYTKVVNELYEVEPLGYTYGLGVIEEPPVYDPGRVLYYAALTGGDGLASAGVSRNLESIAQTAAPDAPLQVTLRSDNVSLAKAVDTAGTGLETIRATGTSLPTVYAFIRGLDPEQSGTTQVRVFVNAPDANADTPTTGNAHYVTTIGFFGPVGRHEGHGDSAPHDMRKNAAVDLTPALKALIASGADVADTITVQLVPVALAKGVDPGSVVVEAIELAVV